MELRPCLGVWLVALLCCGGATGAATIHQAAAKGDAEAVKALLDKGANVNAEDEKGRTPLHLAASKGHKDVVTLLLEKGADVKAEDKLGRTPLHVARSADVVRLLVGKGADVKLPSVLGLTPLHRAAWDGRKVAAAALLEKGAAPGVKTDVGVTPLHLAALAGRKEVVDLLLAKGAKVGADTEAGMTALHLASLAGHGTVVSALVAKGAPADARDNSGRTAHEVALNKQTAALCGKGPVKRAADLTGVKRLRKGEVPDVSGVWIGEKTDESVSTKFQGRSFSRRLPLPGQPVRWYPGYMILRHDKKDKTKIYGEWDGMLSGPWKDAPGRNYGLWGLLTRASPGSVEANVGLSIMRFPKEQWADNHLGGLPVQGSDTMATIWMEWDHRVPKYGISLDNEFAGTVETCGSWGRIRGLGRFRSNPRRDEGGKLVLDAQNEVIRSYRLFRVQREPVVRKARRPPTRKKP